MSTETPIEVPNAVRAEALEGLIELDAALLALEANAGDTALADRVFSAVHTIAGSRAAAGVTHFARFVRTLQQAFDLAREGHLAVTPDLIDGGLQACPVLQLILDEKGDEGVVPGEADAAAAFTRLLQAPGGTRADQRQDLAPRPPIRAAGALLDSIPQETFELFVVECEEHLDGIERDALALERQPTSRAHLDGLFRAVHTIKGNTGLLLGMITGAPIVATHPLRQLLLVAHGLESLLEAFRVPGGAPVSAEAIQTALESRDAIRALLGSLMHGGGARGVPVALLARLGVPAAPAPRVASVDGQDAAFRNTASQCVEVIAGCVRRMDDDAALSDPVVGTYLRGLKTWLAAARYRNCPEMEAPLVEQLRILDAAAAAGAVIGPDQRRALGDAFSAAQSVLARVLAADGAAPPPAKLSADPVAASGALTTVRIDQNKLDGLVRIVGELLVARGTFPVLIRNMTAGADSAGTMRDLKDAGSRISRIADELQSSVMSIRMLPIKTVFQRFPRLVRDLARSLGKDVRLVIEGEDTEMDKAILEQIGDPLVHVIRNAVDHGIESPEERRAQGKDASGQLILRACREAGGVVIEVTEDGRGLDVEALKRKAVAGGLITPEAAAAMSEDAAFHLIFLPGLTTAAAVTDVSGRGVGMDVVRSNVRSLHGTIDIRSQAGRGTTFAIRLPASLLISKGILVEAGAQEYILPLVNIRDMVRLSLHDAHQCLGLTLAQVRGTTYSLVNLAERLSLTPATMPQISVALVEAGAATYGLVVDRFLTEVEVLVKPLTGGLEHCREFQGAAIMGDGRVVLVLNALECHGTGRSYAVN